MTQITFTEQSSPNILSYKSSFGSSSKQILNYFNNGASTTTNNNNTSVNASKGKNLISQMSSTNGGSSGSNFKTNGGVNHQNFF